MKITPTQLRRIIYEEVVNSFGESMEKSLGLAVQSPHSAYERPPDALQRSMRVLNDASEILEDEEILELARAMLDAGLLQTAEDAPEEAGLEEILKEFGGMVGGLAAVAGRGDNELDMPDADEVGPMQNAEDQLTAILIELGHMLETWEETPYHSDEDRYKSYFDDVRLLLEKHDPCMHHGEKCDEAHPQQSHEECIAVSINDGLQEGKEDCFDKKTFKGKSKCIQRTQNKSKESADKIVGAVVRDTEE